MSSAMYEEMLNPEHEKEQKKKITKKDLYFVLISDSFLPWFTQVT